MTIIAFTKVKLPYGWLGNMAPFPIVHEGRSYRTTEALFQALRFDRDDIREVIRTETSPMSAKMRAKRYRDHMVVEPLGDEDVANMRMILELKIAAHPELRAELLRTGDATIIEDCTKRPHEAGLFWGAAFKAGMWRGQNVLGHSWMEIRENIQD